MAKKIFGNEDEKAERMERATSEFPAVTFPASNEPQVFDVEDTSPSPQPAANDSPVPAAAAPRAPRAGEAKFVAVAGSEVIIDVNGNGERIPYVPEKHDKLKAGDPVAIER